MPDTSPEDILAPRFAALGLNDKALGEATRNKKIAATWTEVLEEAGIDGNENTTPTDPKVGSTLTALVAATAKGDSALGGKRVYIVRAILEGRVKSNVQVDAAVKYVKGAKGGIDDATFDKECGVGMVSCGRCLDGEY
jgi:glutaminyl-tRNA synthetase